MRIPSRFDVRMYHHIIPPLQFICSLSSLLQGPRYKVIRYLTRAQTMTWFCRARGASIFLWNWLKITLLHFPSYILRVSTKFVNCGSPCSLHWRGLPRQLQVLHSKHWFLMAGPATNIKNLWSLSDTMEQDAQLWPEDLRPQNVSHTLQTHPKCRPYLMWACH